MLLPDSQTSDGKQQKQQRDEHSRRASGTGFEYDSSIEGDEKEPEMQTAGDRRSSVLPRVGVNPGPCSVGCPEQYEEVAEPEPFAEGDADQFCCLCCRALNSRCMAPVMPIMERSCHVRDEQQRTGRPQWPHNQRPSPRRWPQQADHGRGRVAQQRQTNGP